MDEQVPESYCLRVDDLVINPGARLVHRGEEAIELPRLSFHLLLELAEAAPNVLTHDDLIDRVWTGRIVSQETVTQRVKLLRKALGDDAHAPRYVGLVRGEGYRILPVVKVTDAFSSAIPAGAKRPSRRRNISVTLLIVVLATMGWIVSQEFLRTSGVPGLAEPAPNSVAVLPFVNASESPEDLYLSEGLGDELRDQLGRHLGLSVAARSSSMSFLDQAPEATEIADRLGVSSLIEGTLRREANQLRISLQIIDGRTGFQTWSQSYNLRMQDLLRVQRQIAQEVIQQLLPMADETAIDPMPATRSVSANELMLLANHYDKQVRDQPIVDQVLLLKAIELYREAIDVDPVSAIAHSRLGAALLYLGDLNAAEAPIFEALRLDPDLAHVQYTLGLYHWSRREPGAGAAFERAISINPNLVDAISAYAMWLAQDFEFVQAKEHFRNALLLDRMSHARYLELGNHLGIGGWVEEAKLLALEIEQRFAANDAQAYRIIARIHELAGELDIALAWALRSAQARPEETEARWLIAELLARLEMTEQAEMYESEPGIGQLYWQRRWQDLVERGESLILEYPNETEIWYALAWAYNATGQYEQTVRLLETAGLPGHALGESRRSIDVEATMTLADAYDATGDFDAAQALAQWYLEHLSEMHSEVPAESWWPDVYLGCALAILRRDDEALNMLEEVANAKGLVWYPLVADAHCFQRFSENGRYRRVLGALDERKAGLRRQVSGSLAAAGISLDPLDRSE